MIFYIYVLHFNFSIGNLRVPLVRVALVAPRIVVIIVVVIVSTLSLPTRVIIRRIVVIVVVIVIAALLIITVCRTAVPVVLLLTFPLALRFTFTAKSFATLLAFSLTAIVIKSFSTNTLTVTLLLRWWWCDGMCLRW